MPRPTAILDEALKLASEHIAEPIVTNLEVVSRVKLVCRSGNRAGARMLLAGLLAKIHEPEIDALSQQPMDELDEEDLDA